MGTRGWTSKSLILLAPVLIILTQVFSTLRGNADTLLYVSKSPTETGVYVVDTNQWRRFDMLR